MPDPTLRLEVVDGVALVTIDRPERRNAMSRDAWIELGDILRTVRMDDDARGLIVTGTGERVFAAGADVRELVDRDPAVALDGLVQGILNELEDLPVPTVAALNGHALGGGWELALACDLRVAAEGSRVGFPEVGLGILPGAGGTQRVLQHVGLGRAKELVLSGRVLDAREALDFGLVNRVVEPGRVLETSRELLIVMLEQSPIAVRLAKTVLNATARGHTSWEMERLAYTLSFHSPDREQRMRAFLERRSRSRER